MNTPFKFTQSKSTSNVMFVLMLMLLTVTFSCNKDNWWDIFKNGGKGTKSGCIDKTRIKPYKFCRKVNDPVCGCDGKTYANPCEADKNGVLKFTKGKCNQNGGGNNDGCIDKTRINPNKPCTEELNPVCGCDGKDYSNPCQAEKNGVLKFTKGKCNPNGGGNNDGCIDKSRIDPDKPCTKELNPVCGCDGKDYSNPCEAGKNGVIKYAMGKCKPDGGGNGSNDCIDKSRINPNIICPKEDNPVCGCDNKDYANPCEADKNGVVKYTKGKCQK